MIRHAYDWSEHAALVQLACPNSNFKNYKRPPRKVEEAQAYLNSGFREWTVEDANDNLLTARVKDGIENAAKLAMDAEKPVRITLAVHAPGDGIIHRGRRRTTVQKPKLNVWFYEDKDDKEEMERNAAKGMPPKLLSLLYGLNIRTAVEKVGLANRRLPKVDKPFCRTNQNKGD